MMHGFLDLDGFRIYLIVVNALSFLAYAVTSLIARAKGEGSQGEEAGLALASLAAVSGGGLGLFVAFLIWSRKVSKNNVAIFFLGLEMVIVWTLVLLNVYGPVHFNFGQLTQAVAHRDHRILGIYLVIVNLVTLALFLIDKKRAEKGESRIPEAALLGPCLIGGGLGGLIGIYSVRHKTRKSYFTFGVPFKLVLSLVVIAYLMQCGLI